MKDLIKEWAKNEHARINQFYGEDLPYGFHLDMVAAVAQKYLFLIPKKDVDLVISGCYVHDLIEDSHRITYGSFKEELSKFLTEKLTIEIPSGNEFIVTLANLSFALANNTGKTRKDRANNLFYSKLRGTEYGVFIKMCDRIANVLFGVMFGGSMLEKYKRELPDFLGNLECNEFGNYQVMVDDLKNLVENKTYRF